jgi:hypothetical protein
LAGKRHWTLLSYFRRSSAFGTCFVLIMRSTVGG